MDREKYIRGAIYGLLVGDAVGVPYEFKVPSQLPDIEQIDMIPPKGFARTYASLPIGTWSDDGAQALCLLASLLDQKKLNPEDFMQRICDWYQSGYMAVDGQVFDVGIQMVDAIHRYQSGIELNQVAKNDEYANGNGALMRVLPLALWHQGSNRELIEAAFIQSHLTHAHIRSKLCCALYCLWVRKILDGCSIQDSWIEAIEILKRELSDQNGALDELEHHILSDDWDRPTGTGYVVDCLKSAYYALQASDYEKVIKTAIALGNDTDTTACVAGGIAGLYYGVDAIPSSWMNHLRGKEMVEELLVQWL